MKKTSIITLLSLLIFLSSCAQLSESDKKIETKLLNEQTTRGNIALFNQGLTIVPDFGKYLSGTGADNITSIDLSGNEIKVLDGKKFEVFKNLKELNVSFNKIEKIKNTEKLNNLVILYGVQNNITSLNGFDNLKKLQLLDLSFNKINDLQSLSNLNNLKSVNLAHNEINDIKPLFGLSRLEKVKLEFNNISDISGLVNNKNIKVLTVSHNNIPDSLVKELNEMSLKNMENGN